MLLHYIYLLLGVILYALFSLNLLICWTDNDWVNSSLMAFSLLLHLLFFHNHTKQKSVFNVEELFTSIVLWGLGALSVIGFAFTSDIFMDVSIKISSLQAIFNLLIIYASLCYFLYGLMMYRKLIFYRKDRHITRLWRLFLIVLAVSILIRIQNFAILEYALPIVCLSAGGFLMLLILTRLKWIAVLTMKTKWLSMMLLIIIGGIGVFLLQHLANIDLPGLIFAPLYHNTFFALLSGSMLAYTFLSFLAILFNLPISSVLEEQMKEIRSYQEISTALLDKESAEETMDRLFNVCYNNTYSSSGWLLFKPAQEKGQLRYAGNITHKNIENLNKRLDFEELSLTQPVKGYYYYPDLIKAKVVEDKESPFQSLLVLPITVSGDKKNVGAICLIKPYPEGFDEYMIKLAKSYVDQAKLALENMQLLEKTIATARYKEELEIANKVQQALMPRKFPATEFCEIAAFNESAKEVGGDYYDFSRIDDYRLAVVIGDVSGKGTHAAFHMAQMKGIFQSLMQLCLPADNFMVMANQAVSNCLERNRFITLAYVSLDFAENTVTFSRAGHCPILFYSAKEKEILAIEGGGMGLGIIRSEKYMQYVEAHQKQLHVGDVIVLYTDGFVEGRAANSDTNEYGSDRLKDCLARHINQSAETIKEALYLDFKEFTAGSAYKDDTSLVVIKIKKLESPSNTAILDYSLFE